MKRGEEKGRFTGVIPVLLFVNLMIFSTRAYSAPAWSGTGGTTTSEQWSFSDWNYGPLHPDAGWVNPFGTDPEYPYLVVNPGADHSLSLGSHTGVWALGSSGIDVVIPNNPDSGPGTQKEMWIELTWSIAGRSRFLPDQLMVDVFPLYDDENASFRMETLRTNQSTSQDGQRQWFTTLYKVDIWPNPPGEWITIKGDIYIDNVAVDTICIPEPATFGLLIGGAIMAFRNRKKI